MKSKFLFSLVLCSVFCTVFSNASKAEIQESKTIRFEALFEQALIKSPVLSDMRAQIQMQRGASITNSTLENPVLDAEIRKPHSPNGERGEDEIALSLSQPLRVSDFGSRSTVERLLNDLADLDAKTELLIFKQKLKLAYVRCWTFERRQKELTQYAAAAKHVEKSVMRAHEAGLFAKSEAVLFTTEIKRARLELETLGAEILRVRAELARLVGDGVDGILEAPKLNLDESQITAYSQSQVPASVRAKIMARLAAEQQRQARLDAFPKFAPRLVFERSNDDREYFGFGISVELPVFNRNQGEQIGRKAGSESAEAWARYVASPEFEAEVSAYSKHLQTSAKLIRGYEEEIVPAIKNVLDLEIRSFDDGKSSPTRVWQALKELSAVQAEVIERLAKLHSDSIEFTILTGQEF